MSISYLEPFVLTKNDIPRAFLLGRKPGELKNTELKSLLKCRGYTGMGLKTNAKLEKIAYKYAKSGKDKEIADPDPHKKMTHRIIWKLPCV